jgi:hypothetical protein
MKTTETKRQVRRDAKFRYYEFLKDIHSVIESNKSCSIKFYCRKHKIARGQLLTLKELGIVKRIRINEYKWLKGKPTMLMAQKILDKQLNRRIDQETKVIDKPKEKKIITLSEQKKEVKKSNSELSILWGLIKYTIN